jgi:hypothetical protein
VAKWLESNDTPSSDKKKSRRRSLHDKKKLIKGVTSKVDLFSMGEHSGRLMFSFALSWGDHKYHFGCDSSNSMAMWIDACRYYRPWWEEYDFATIAQAAMGNNSNHSGDQTR